MYDLSPGITMRSTILAYSYRHGLNFIPGIVKTRIDCYSGISNPSLIVMAPDVQGASCGSCLQFAQTKENVKHWKSFHHRQPSHRQAMTGQVGQSGYLTSILKNAAVVGLHQ